MKKQEDASEKQYSILRLATTTSIVDSGLLEKLITVFERRHSIKVKVIAKGSGAAIQLARDGKADVIIVHARDAENRFIIEGYGVNRMNVMYNDFVILGPPSDPIQIQGETDVLVALKKISYQKATFVSRGDNSGTHVREISFWKQLDIQPDGHWYIETSKGMLETLRMASRQRAYVLADRSTYLFNRKELDLVVIVEGDKRLFNPYGIIAVNPIKVSGVNFSGAMAFVDYVTSREG